VSPGYFDALGIPLLRGRLLDARDGANAARVAVVSDTLARTLWPGRDPVGERLARHEADSAFQPKWLEVVGVVRDVRRPLSDGWSVPAYYVPIEQHSLSFGMTEDPRNSRLEAERVRSRAFSGTDTVSGIIFHGVVVVRVFVKKGEKTPPSEMALALQRARELET
jgi:L-asparaginase II